MPDGEPVGCEQCGTAAADPGAARLTWSVAVEPDRAVWTCGDCSRRHLRSIEARLDPDWW